MKEKIKINRKAGNTENSNNDVTYITQKIMKVQRSLLPIFLFLLLICLTSCQSDYIVLRYNLEGKVPTNETVSTFLGYSFLISVLCLVTAILVAILLYKLERKWNGLWNFFEYNLTWCFFTVWVFGFCVYNTGMVVTEGTSMSPDGVIDRMMMVCLMSAIHAFGMFVFSNDISSVFEPFHNNTFYMALFSLVHFLAALVSLIFVIKHFGYNIISRVRLWYTCIFGREKDDLFVFWGQNEPSFHLAKDINKKHNRSFRVLFVKTSDSEDTTDNLTGFDRLLNFFSMKNKELDELKKIQCFSIAAFRRLSMCEISSAEKGSGNVSVLKNKIGLHSIPRLFALTSKNIHIFMLGDDNDANIKAAGNICADKHLNDFTKSADGRKCIIYCHARYDSVSKVIENERFADNLEVRIIDSAHMSVDILKGNEDMMCQPVYYVDVNDDATVSTAFNAMIIGFGQCGRDALKFLYEYGAFASANNKDVRSPFHCDVFDIKMNEVGAYFKNIRPQAGIKLFQKVRESSKCCNCSKALCGNIEEKKDLVHLYEMDIHSQQFWEFVDRDISKQNYIVISIKDDEAGITLAVRLLKHAIRKEANLSAYASLYVHIAMIFFHTWKVLQNSITIRLLNHII